MRILLLNHNVAWSVGTFYRALNFGRSLAAQGHQVRMVSISRRKRFGFTTYLRDGIEMVESPDLFWGIGRTGWDPWDTLNRITYLAPYSYDIIHAFDSRPAVILPALVLSRLRRTPLVLDWADWWGRGGTIEERPYRLVRVLFGGIETFFEEAFRRSADATTVISRPLAGRAEKLGVSATEILRLPQGCDTESVRPIDQDTARRRLGLPLETPLVGHLGVLFPRDAELLFSAYQQLAGRVEPALSLVLVGRHRATIPAGLQSGGQVIETGFVADEELPFWLAACDVTVLPLTATLANQARWPSRGNAYLAAGRPVITTRVSDFHEYVTNWDAGLVVGPDDTALAQGIAGALNDPAARDRWGAQARRLAEGPLSWETLTEQLANLYARLAPLPA